MSMSFLDTCKAFPSAHHTNCRKRNSGKWFRKSVNPDKPDFECPHGYDWIEDVMPEATEKQVAMATERYEKCQQCASARDEASGCVLHSGCCFGNKRATQRDFHCPGPDKKW